jgi:hypothetical protein
VLIAISAIFILTALFFLGTMLRQTRRGRPLRATLALAAVAISASLAALVVLVGTSYLGYQRLTEEKLVGLIEFSRNAPDEYSARLMIDGQLDRLLTLRGDEWQLDARIITWQPPATILGLEPVYQLERLSGRYSSIDRELSEPRTVHGLAEERALDLWSLARNFPRLTPGVDAFYGSATYLPMADGARFRITLSRDAIIARPVNDSARRAVGDWGQLAK